VDLDAPLRRLGAAHGLELDALTAQAFHSPSWYRLAALRPMLKREAQVRRHRFRGAVWHVVRDPASGRFHRLTPAAYQLLGLLDGRRTMDQVWDAVVSQMGEEAPGQEEVIGLLSQLHASDLLLCEVTPDSAELFERYAQNDRSRRPPFWKNPFSIRIPLWDPDHAVQRLLPWLRPLFGWTGAIAYLAVVIAGMVLAGLHWPELTANIGDRVLAADNLLVLGLTFPLVKFLHEMGHAIATRAGGGEVHEMGVMFLVFMPVPYVDASAASGFRSKWQRALVGAAGMLVEVFIAALAMFAWVMAEPGLVRAIAFNVMLIAGVSTVVFNANPLLRFDGYYIFSDLVEIPNLSTRGTRHWRWLAERYLFRMPNVEPPAATPGERRWFTVYTPAALAYRISVSVAIMLYFASQWFFIGVVLAVWGTAAMLVWPLVKAGDYLLQLPRAGRTRRRALTVTGVTLAVLAILLCVVPAPARLLAQGVVWLPDEAQVRAGADGFIRTVLAAPGTSVKPGTPLLESREPAVETELRVAEARVAELQARLELQRFDDRVAAEVTRQELAFEQARADRALERLGQLVVASRAAGTFVLDQATDLPGRYLRKGELVGYVVPGSGPARKLVRVVVTQDDIDLVRNRLRGVQARAAGHVDRVMPARVVREVPAARDHLPSNVLSSEGGGTIAADPREPHSGKTLATTFQFDLELPEDAPPLGFGTRVHVRFDLQPEPLAQQAFRRLRQLFLAQFHV
jgi:putative peptide zinc metalloprotease protein